MHRPLRAADIAPLIDEHRASSWAVDVPFGWPDLCVALMADRHKGPLPAVATPAAADWEKWRARQVAQRLTDRFLTDDPRLKSLRVAAIGPLGRSEGGVEECFIDPVDTVDGFYADVLGTLRGWSAAPPKLRPAHPAPPAIDETIATVLASMNSSPCPGPRRESDMLLRQGLLGSFVVRSAGEQP